MRQKVGQKDAAEDAAERCGRRRGRWGRKMCGRKMRRKMCRKRRQKDACACNRASAGRGRLAACHVRAAAASPYRVALVGRPRRSFACDAVERLPQRSRGLGRPRAVRALLFDRGARRRARRPARAAQLARRKLDRFVLADG
eukprot:5501049-Prymnesium_polylepis.1